ncbi:MAG: glycosyltransferase [Desulfosudis oleivorans]|nr:glycosyltransferase [Desulfosudis oleivorans]
MRLSRNFGHQYALLAGLEAAEGDAVIMMDCDLQHPVEMIPRHARTLARGFQGGEDPAPGRLPTSAGSSAGPRASFYRLFSALSGVDLQPGLADFRLLDRQALNELLRLQGGRAVPARPHRMDRLPVLRHPLPGRPARLRPVAIQLEEDGPAGLERGELLFDHALADRHHHRIDRQPGVARWASCTAFFGKIFGQGLVPGWASTLMVISLLFFLLFVYLGVLGEYIGRIIIEVRRRPRFIVCETKGFGDRGPLPYDGSGASPAGRMAGTGPPAAIRLVVNADDFGISERVNDGIVAGPSLRDRHRRLPDGRGPRLRACRATGAGACPRWMSACT